MSIQWSLCAIHIFGMIWIWLDMALWVSIASMKHFYYSNQFLNWVALSFIHWTINNADYSTIQNSLQCTRFKNIRFHLFGNDQSQTIKQFFGAILWWRCTFWQLGMGLHCPLHWFRNHLLNKLIRRWPLNCGFIPLSMHVGRQQPILYIHSFL